MFLFRKKGDKLKSIPNKEEGIKIETMTEDLIKLSVFYTTLTRKLLEVKGFDTDYSYELISERIALLHTEVSELVDAEKKGLSGEEKGDEIADIVIRLLNFPVIIPSLLLDIKSTVPGKIHETKLFMPDEISASLIVNRDDYINEIRKTIRMSVANTMHEKITQLNKAIIDHKNNKKTSELIIVLIFDILNLCELYVKISPSIQGNIHDLINSKMTKNFERPYKYNVSENF